MKAESMTLIEWQAKYSDERSCLFHLAELRWPEGYRCCQCNHESYYFIEGYRRFECRSCGEQTSVTAGSLFHATKLPLVKWFTAIYFVSVDKGGISASRLAKYIDVHWTTARNMLKRIRRCMADRDGQYLLSGLIELDDALVGGKTTGGKRGRGAEGKTAILVACEHDAQHQKAGFLKMTVVEHVNSEAVKDFSDNAIESGQDLRTDGSPTLKTLEGTHRVESLVIPPQETHKWLPWVHIAIANLKRFLLGTFHGVSGAHLQEYLDEFCYRFNRRWCELQIPNRLLRICLNHPPLKRSLLWT